MTQQDGHTSPLRILDETPDLLVIDKPPFLLVHPSKPGGPLTLWDYLKEFLAYEVASGGQVSLINRLDRETSGIVLIAKHHAAARECAGAMERGEIGKGYLAIVEGWPERDEWSVDAPLLRLGEVQESRVWLKRGVHSGGDSSLTEFRVELRLTHPVHGAVALVRCWPRTGRTHQIRVHLAHSGFPVVGDKIYGTSEAREECYLEFIESGWTEKLAQRLWLPRHALHSCNLSLQFKGNNYEWHSGLPEDLGDFLSLCGGA